MRYNFNINQKSIIDNNLNIDVIDACLIDYLIGFSLSSKIIKMQHNENTYYYFSHSKIMQDCPLLNLKKDSIYRRLKNLCEVGLLEQHPNSKGLRMSMYAFTDLLQNIIIGNTATSDENPKGIGRKSDGVSDENPNYNTINNNTINIDKEIMSEQSSDDTPLLNLDVTNQTLEIKITKSFFDLFRKIQEENGVTVFTKYDKTKLKSWLVHIKRMIELDKVTLEDLREVHVWLSDPKFKNSEFWRKNIISTQKLREQFPKLQSAMKDDLKTLSKNKPQRSKSRLGL